MVISNVVRIWYSSEEHLFYVYTNKGTTITVDGFLDEVNWSQESMTASFTVPEEEEEVNGDK